MLVEPIPFVAAVSEGTDWTILLCAGHGFRFCVDQSSNFTDRRACARAPRWLARYVGARLGVYCVTALHVIQRAAVKAFSKCCTMRIFSSKYNVVVIYLEHYLLLSTLCRLLAQGMLAVRGSRQ